MNVITTLLAAGLAWETFLLIPMVPGKLLDTRDFSPLPRWQYNSFNVFLTSLGIVSLVVVAGLIVSGGSAWVWSALILSVLYLLVFLLDLLEIFPVVPDQMPVQLLVLEGIGLASAAGLTALAAALIAG